VLCRENLSASQAKGSRHGQATLARPQINISIASLLSKNASVLEAHSTQHPPSYRLRFFYELCWSTRRAFATIGVIGNLSTPNVSFAICARLCLLRQPRAISNNETGWKSAPNATLIGLGLDELSRACRHSQEVKQAM
jgi:hypothetical protein